MYVENDILVNPEPAEDDGDGGFYVDFTVECDEPDETMPTVASMLYQAQDSSNPPIALYADGPSSVDVDIEKSSKRWLSSSQSVDVDCSTAQTYPVILTITPSDQSDYSIPSQVKYNGGWTSSGSTSDVEITIRVKGGCASVKTRGSKLRDRERRRERDGKSRVRRDRGRNRSDREERGEEERPKEE